MRTSWNDRYGAPGYLFGTEPSEFLRRNASLLGPGSEVLCVADGEGRNSVHLAGLGHRVTAFDASEVGVGKARALAREAGVEVDFNLRAAEDWDWSRGFDAVVGIFIQFAPPDLRKRLFGWMAGAVRPGGLLLLQGYALRQVGYGTGGPSDPGHLYDAPMLRQAFAGFEIVSLEDYDRQIREGPGHSGRSALVELVARRPAA